jgi:hypothetical protein
MWHGGRDLPPWRWAAGSWRHAARSWRHAAWSCRRKFYPATMPCGGRDLTLWGMTVGTCRRGVWRHMYISRNFWFEHLFFENQKKSPACDDVGPVGR